MTVHEVPLVPQEKLNWLPVRATRSQAFGIGEGLGRIASAMLRQVAPFVGRHCMVIRFCPLVAVAAIIWLRLFPSRSSRTISPALDQTSAARTAWTRTA